MPWVSLSLLLFLHRVFSLMSLTVLLFSPFFLSERKLVGGVEADRRAYTELMDEVDEFYRTHRMAAVLIKDLPISSAEYAEAVESLQPRGK